MKKCSMLILSCACMLGAVLLVAPGQVQAQSSTLTKGAQSEQVLELQQQLHSLGYFKAGYAGYYGSLTSKAVARFQRDYGLTPDGVAGAATQAKLDSFGKVRLTAKWSKSRPAVISFGRHTFTINST
ncbi:peptidoglycan-binding protein [Paenibacillus sp. NRS-1783]|uniref:peptidoglycan-binding domain-containing protein n=1 Tax=unclassified Paenibacillus TaxID=185978 RepID=UPI003D2B101D